MASIFAKLKGRNKKDNWLFSLTTGCVFLSGLTILCCLLLGMLPVVDRIFADPLEFVALCLAYPLFEEVIFRGFILGELRNRLDNGFLVRGVSKANLITSILFCGVHAFAHGTTLSALTFFPSLILGLLRESGGSIPLCVFVHSLWNCSLLMFLF